jgi:hypothetical protein
MAIHIVSLFLGGFVIAKDDAMMRQMLSTCRSS